MIILFDNSPSAIFGLTMNSSEWKIRKTLKSLGFEYVDNYSGLVSCYSKENIDFRIYPDYKKGVNDSDYCVLKFTTTSGRYYCNLKTEALRLSNY